MSNEKIQMIQKLRRQVTQMGQANDAREKNLDEKEAMLRQGQLPVRNPQDLERNMSRNLGPMLAPGNLGDINKVCWPYYFSTEIPQTTVGPNETFQTGFSITQEAAFIMMSFTKTVYLASGVTAPDYQPWTYLDPNQAGVANRAPGLTFTLRDGSSSRQLYDRPIEIQHYGNPRFPTKLPRPIMFLPNQSVQVAFVNSHAVNRYVPSITVFGYRVRIEDAQNLLSLVYG